MDTETRDRSTSNKPANDFDSAYVRKETEN